MPRRRTGIRISRSSPASKRSSRRSVPIEDFTGTMSLSFRDHRFEPPKYSAEECKDKDMTFSAPDVRHRGVHQQLHRRDQEPDRLHGRLPADVGQGHLHHQRHRACRRVPARPLAGRLLRPPGRQDLRQGHLQLQGDPVPRCVARVRDRQARRGRRPHRPQAQAERHRPAQGARLGRGADPGAVRPVRVDARHPGEGPHHRPGRRAARHLPQAAAGRAADAGVGAGAAGEPVLQPEALRPGQGRPLQGQQEAGAGAADQPGHADRGGHRRHHRVPRPAARRRGGDEVRRAR